MVAEIIAMWRAGTGCACVCMVMIAIWCASRRPVRQYATTVVRIALRSVPTANAPVAPVHPASSIAHPVPVTSTAKGIRFVPGNAGTAAATAHRAATAVFDASRGPAM